MSLPDSLVDESVLTPRQFEALQSYLRVAVGEMRYREAASASSQGRKRGAPGPVTIGSYFRTVQQARENIRRSVVTLLIAVWLGLVKPDDVRRLLDTAGGDIAGLSEEQRDQFLAVLRALLRKIVM